MQHHKMINTRASAKGLNIASNKEMGGIKMAYSRTKRSLRKNLTEGKHLQLSS